MLWIVVSIFCPIPSGLTPFHPLWEMGSQDKPRSSRAEQSSTLPSPKHPQAIFTRQPRITLHLRPATHLSTNLYRVLTEHLLRAQYCVWCYPRCIPAQTWFQNRSMMADIYRISLRAYLVLSLTGTYFDLEIKLTLDEYSLSDTFDKYQNHFAQVLWIFSGCLPWIQVLGFMDLML